MLFLFAPGYICMLLVAVFFHAWPQSSSPDHIPPRWLETVATANIQLFQCNANPHICTFSVSATANFLCIWKSLLRVSSLRSTAAAIVDRRRLPSRVMQSSRVAVVLSGSEQWPPPVTVASPVDRRLMFHPLTLLSLCRKLHCCLNAFSVIWNIPSVNRPHSSFVWSCLFMTPAGWPRYLFLFLNFILSVP